MSQPEFRKEGEAGDRQPIMVRSRMTIGELMSMDLPEPNWLVPGMISMGLTSVSGRPKVGKSKLCLQLAAAKATGEYFLSRKLEKGRVLYIDLENPPIRIQERAQKMEIPITADLVIESKWPHLDNGGLKDLEEDIKIEKWDLVIIDTLSRVLSVKADQLKLGQMSEMTGKLQTLAMSYKMSIILIDHQRKGNRNSGYDPVDDILGSTGKSAPLDTILGLYRKGETVTLKIVGRDIEEQEIKLQLDPESLNWSVREEARSQNHSRKDSVLHASGELLDKDVMPTTTNIADHLGLDKGNVSSDLKELEAEGKMVAGEKQGRDKPYYPANRQPIKP